MANKDAFYFSHDSNARGDPKILAMRSIYGSEGYGWYWMIVEMMRDEESYKLPITKYTFDTIAMQTQCERIKIEQFINDCCNEFVDKNGGLFCADDSFLWSESLLQRMKKLDEKRKKASESARVRWDSNKDDANAMPTQYECNASKVNKSNKKTVKIKEIKDQFKDTVLLTQKEYEKLVYRFGEQQTMVMIEYLDNKKLANGYKYKSDYHVLIGWVKDHFEKVKNGNSKQGNSGTRQQSFGKHPSETDWDNEPNSL